MSIPGSIFSDLAGAWSVVPDEDLLASGMAAAGDFKWSNPAAWIDSVPGVAGAVPNNTVHYEDTDEHIVARYYNVVLSNKGTITLDDMGAQIDRLSIEGAQSELKIAAPYTLEVLLGTTLSNGTLTMAGGTLATSEFLMSGGLLTGYGTIGGSPTFKDHVETTCASLSPVEWWRRSAR